MEPPRAGELSVYVGGHGFGESVVLVTPTLEVLVMDSCRGTEDGGRPHVPLDLLRAFELDRIDLLVVSHADLDHCSGVPELLQAVRPAEIWRFPYFSLAELLARALQSHPDAATVRRMRDVRVVLDSLDQAVLDGIADEASISTRVLQINECSVHCLAPSAVDKQRSSSECSTLMQWNGTEAELAGKVAAYLGDGGHRPGSRGNVLSIALAVQWNDVRVVLGGDVEATGVDRGWDGVVKTLERRDETDLLRQPSIVKLAHHGSSGAIHEGAWALHTMDGHRPVAVGTAYQRGAEAGRPPQTSALEHLATYCDRLGATASPVASDWQRFRQAGWSQLSSSGDGQLSHWVGVAIDPQGTVRFMSSPGARWFCSTTPT